MSENKTEMLTDDSKAKLLKKCESDIRKGQQAFLTTARAVQTIRTKKLYEPDYKTAGEYFDEKWDMSPADVTRYKNAAEVVELLELKGFTRLPENEGQARSLREVEGVERRIEVWKQAIESGKKITAKLILELANQKDKPQKQWEAFVAKTEAEAGMTGETLTVFTVPTKRHEVLDSILEQIATLRKEDGEGADWVLEQIANLHQTKIEVAA